MPRPPAPGVCVCGVWGGMEGVCGVVVVAMVCFVVCVEGLGWRGGESEGGCCRAVLTHQLGLGFRQHIFPTSSEVWDVEGGGCTGLHLQRAWLQRWNGCVTLCMPP